MSDQNDNETLEAVEREGENSPKTASQSVNFDVATVNLEDELKQSFIDYAMSVIVDRALPDVRDGLKPVHRRVLYDMYDLKVWHTGQTKKSARIVGDVIGRFHPHGDTAVYETIVRMAQWFSMREPLIFGQGNFGDIDGDGAAAMRYTEIKMTKIAEAMLTDIDKETVNTYPNYDGNEQIPEVLPTRFPNLLVNGSSGIAVGMATNIPPHNLGEIINGTVALLDNPELTLDELMQYIPGPDFPTGGLIVGNDGIKQAYATGRGRCVIRSRTHIETDKSGRKTIIVDEIPYVVHKVDIVKQIAQLVRDKKIEGIAEVNDLSDKDNAVRIAIDLKRDAYEEAVLNNLYSQTMLQSSFWINMVALVNNHPRQLSLMEVLKEFIKFRREVVTRRTVYLLRQDRRRAHIAEGLMVAKANIQKVIDLITSSQNQDEARELLKQEPWDGGKINALIERTKDGENITTPQGIGANCGYIDGKYYLSDTQARAILALQLSRLTHLASDEILGDYKSLLVNIRDYLDILNNPERMKSVIREDMLACKNEFATPRRSNFVYDDGNFNKADLIAKQDVIVTLSYQGYIKYQDIASYESQAHGGKGRKAASLKEEDFINNVVVANTHDKMLCFTNLGRAFISIVYDLPTSENRTWRGRPVQNVFEIAENERITAMLPVSKFEDDTYFMYATSKGLVKKTPVTAFESFVKRGGDRGIKAINLAEGDELIGVDISSGDDDVYLFTSDGRAIHFCEYYKASKDGNEDEESIDNAEISEDNDAQDSLSRHNGSGVRPSGRNAAGIRGIRLIGDAKVVSMIVMPPNDECAQCLIATANGFGKRIALDTLSLRNRGGQGVFAIRNLERNGDVIGAVKADDESEFMLITDTGILIRSPMNTIRECGRSASGVILMRMDDAHVVGLQAIPENVVENSRKTAQARALEKQAIKEMQEKEASQSLLASEMPQEESDDSQKEENIND
ncbi:MAG: DNA gyrase subunit A [Succinatimonas sp.]|nr:DNA gyrase subunit A [Succinatimonas sp.]